MIPTLLQEKEKEKTNGYWGYILGGIFMMAGVLAAFFSGGAMLALGSGMALYGLDMAANNYFMNETGTYNREGVFKGYMTSQIASRIASIIRTG